MSIKVESVVRAMLDAARGEVADRWPSARAIAECELRKLASTFADVQKMLASGKIELTRARAIIRMQENSARCVLQTVEGISVLTSGRVVSAAMRAAAVVVNPAIGSRLIYGTQPTRNNSKPETPASSSSGTGSKEKAVVATRRPARASRTTAASAEPTEEATPNFKAGKDL